jgi:UDP-N-acetyl-D-mannosaminuronate dehydrogenase
VVAAARETNKKMPWQSVERLKNTLGSLKDKTVVILGLAYRGGVKEHAFSGTIALVEALRSEGARIKVHDPMYSDVELEALGMTSFHLGEHSDAAIIQSNHREYLDLAPEDLPGTLVIIDGRNFSNTKLRSAIETLVLGVGAKLTSGSKLAKN